MAGNVQGPSGTGFDPSPQFWVDRVESDPGTLAVVGRCFFGPIRTGLVFDGIVSEREGAWLASDLVACRLGVAEVYVFRQLADEMDQMLSGQGEGLAELAGIASTPPSARSTPMSLSILCPASAGRTSATQR